MIDFEGFDALTFDCYGTLIDWETGILEALDDLLGPAGTDRERSARLTDFARFEPRAEAGPFRRYRDVLRDVAEMFGEARSVPVDSHAADEFACSVRGWPPFSDTRDALRALSGRYRLAIVSNVDDDLFAGSAAQLGVPFDEVVTAEQVGSYKPGPRHFDVVLERLGLPRERVLHCAQSLYHDIEPARSLGFTTVWVNRRAGRNGGGATPPSSAEPDLEVPDLATLARLVGV